jgi:CelD/BcsL family acetyltransferase involved in cellulose biosynthesis
VLEITPLTTEEDLEALRPEWLRLFEQSRVANPFAHPDWLIAWARHFVGRGELYVLAVRSGGDLVGVAPFSRKSVPRFGPRVTTIRMLGAGRNSHLTELPQVLTAPGQSRRVLRAVVNSLCDESGSWDWAEVSLGTDQGWFEREWIPRRGPGSGCAAIHKATRAFVVVPLAPTWEEFRRGLKRNVKESIRRGGNRLAREGHEYRFVEPNGSTEDTLATLVRLHKARAALEGTEPHGDYFEDPRQHAFLLDAARTLAPAGVLSPLVLEVDGEAVAARLVLESGASSFFSASGFDPAWWSYNVGTTLLALALRRAIEHGNVVANLSHGPDVSKLRWSERLECAHSFLIVGSRRKSRLAFAAFWHLRAEYLRREQRRRHVDARHDRVPELPAPRDTLPAAAPLPVFLD